ncbi:hypothetical protein [Lysobacter sp. A289]
MTEFTVLFIFILVALIVMGKLRSKNELKLELAKVSELASLINMQSVQCSISGSKGASDLYAVFAQQLRNSVSTASAGRHVYPATTHHQVHVITVLLETPTLLLKFLDGQSQTEIGLAVHSLRKILSKLLDISRVG